MTKYDEALTLLMKGRQLYPNNPYFLLKKAQVYENQGEYNEAWKSADSLLKITPNDPSVVDYTEYLYSRRLKNEFGFFYLHSKIIDTNASHTNHIGTVQYTRYFKNGSLAARVNYAGRLTGTGYQFDLEGNYTIAKLIGINLAGSYAPHKDFG